MPTIDDVLSFFSKKAGMKPGGLAGHQVQPGQAAITPIPHWAEVKAGTAPDPLTQQPMQAQSPYDIQRSQQPAAPEYQHPDTMTHGEDIISLLSEAENRAKLPQRAQGFKGVGDGSGGVRYSGGGLGDRQISEEEALSYIKDLHDYAKGAGFY